VRPFSPRRSPWRWAAAAAIAATALVALARLIRARDNVS
jgi:hypothetical protein